TDGEICLVGHRIGLYHVISFRHVGIHGRDAARAVSLAAIARGASMPPRNAPATVSVMLFVHSYFTGPVLSASPGRKSPCLAGTAASRTPGSQGCSSAVPPRHRNRPLARGQTSSHPACGAREALLSPDR